MMILSAGFVSQDRSAEKIGGAHASAPTSAANSVRFIVVCGCSGWKNGLTSKLSRSPRPAEGCRLKRPVVRQVHSLPKRRFKCSHTFRQKAASIAANFEAHEGIPSDSSLA